MKTEAISLLDTHGIKPTPNRILVADALISACAPLSLIELETQIDTLDRSSVLRVLTLMLSHDMVHGLEDGRGVTKYELCHSHDEHGDDDLHVHFYCEKCGRTICLEDHRIPSLSLPEGYTVRSANFMLKGICPECKI